MKFQLWSEAEAHCYTLSAGWWNDAEALNATGNVSLCGSLTPCFSLKFCPHLSCVSFLFLLSCDFPPFFCVHLCLVCQSFLVYTVCELPAVFVFSSVLFLCLHVSPPGVFLAFRSCLSSCHRCFWCLYFFFLFIFFFWISYWKLVFLFLILPASCEFCCWVVTILN